MEIVSFPMLLANQPQMHKFLVNVLHPDTAQKSGSSASPVGLRPMGGCCRALGPALPSQWGPRMARRTLARGRWPPCLFLGPGFWNLYQIKHHLQIQNECLQYEFAYLGQFLLLMFLGHNIYSPNLWPPVGGLVKRFNCCQLSSSELERWNI